MNKHNPFLKSSQYWGGGKTLEEGDRVVRLVLLGEHRERAGNPDFIGGIYRRLSRGSDILAET